MGRHGENIHKRKDGRWEARLLAGYRADGKASYRYLYGKTYLEAKNKRNAVLASDQAPFHASHKQDPSKVLFQQLAGGWLAEKREMVKESTYAHYDGILKQHLLPELGQMPLTALTSRQLDQFLRSKIQHGRLDGAGGLSRKTVSDLRSMLNQILQYGQTQGFALLAVIRISPVSNRAPAIQTFSELEQKGLEQALFSDPTPLSLGILTALYTGLRIGEVCALQWKDISLKNGTIQVQKTMIRIRDLSSHAPAKTKILIDCPKTQCSIRTIPLPDFVIPILAAHQKEGDHYLLTGTSRFMEPRSCLTQYKKFLRAAGIPDHNFHALRHTFATRCIEEGFDVKSLSEIMGHSNVSITMQRYVHPSMERKREQMNKLMPLSIHGQKNRQ